MSNFSASILKQFFVLLVIIYIPISHADSVAESWDPVFNFQLKLAQQGNIKAQYILGEMYEQGRGVAKNYDTAILWYQKAQQNGLQKAAQRINEIKESIKQEALDKVRIAAEKKRQQEEKVRLLALKKQNAEKARRQQAARAEAKEPVQEIVKKQVQEPSQATELSPEERAEKIKQAQLKAEAIAKQNAQRQQQQADAELRKYRASLSTSSQPQQNVNQSAKYEDPFE